jgi:YD repeat-containing protein
MGDETRLHQALSNLLNNAARYTPDGGEIEVSLATDGDEAVLRVRDNGIGIRGEDLQRIFEAFTQADRIPGRLHEGLGIGLTLARQLAEMHGGTIRARSAGPDAGSEFELRLPLARREPDPAPDPTRAGPVPALRRRVLVVDDNRDSADTLVSLLRAAGHQTEVAYDGRGALASFRDRLPEVVLLDIELPGGLDGHQVARLMREAAGDVRVRLVAVTGRGSAEDRLHSEAAGFDLHVVKPLDPGDLERIVG